RVQELMARFETRFIERCFTAHERETAEARRSGGGHIAAYAKRFAAKEAVAKALGSGFSGGITMKDIGVVTGERGEPRIQLSGAAQKRLAAITPGGHETFIHLALSDEPPLAQAVVIIEARSA
ncbi:MAG TPA: holo-ACP synthase, partial [Alphaproteobacteria bacterium]|nr:holo-ACP synthase [Alphaproteobacteria bacterium]